MMLRAAAPPPAGEGPPPVSAGAASVGAAELWVESRPDCRGPCSVPRLCPVKPPNFSNIISEFTGIVTPVKMLWVLASKQNLKTGKSNCPGTRDPDF